MSRFISWGGNQYGQLGIGSLEQQNAETPTELSQLRDVEVQQISCGESHTLFLLNDGSVYSCGNNEYGQLGHDKRQSRPEHVDSLKDQKIVQISAGMSHSVFLSEGGGMFSSGCNMYGQLGTKETEPENCRVPRLIKLSHTVKQVSCGRNHCVALTDDGNVLSWGDNKFGQLGLGNNRSEQEPQLIGCIRGIPIAQVVCGGSHSFILSKSGTLFGWGRNCFGQLGVNDEKDRLDPTLCKSLRYQMVTYIACGEDHSAALTQTGGLYTFGAGMFGQLGHGSKTNEMMPRCVPELMGSAVTQVACGRRHTLVHVGESGRVYVFGSGSNHQLGNGSTSVKPLPEPVKGPFVYSGARNSAAMDTGRDGLYAVNKISAGGDYCFVWATQPEKGIKPADMRIPDPRSQIDCLTPELVSEICRLGAGEEVPSPLEKKLRKIMSSAACINASFLLSDNGHFGSGSRNHGVDMAAVRESLTKIGDSHNVVVKQKILQAIEGVLIPSLPSSPPDVEALRVYLILPELHFFEYPKYYKTLIEPFGKSINNLGKGASRVLDSWWGSFSETHFLRVVYTYKETVIYILQLPEAKTPSEQYSRNQALYVLLDVLKKLNNVNEQKGQIIAYHKFYISCVQDKINLKEDYFYWVKTQNRQDTVGRVLFCNYPFLFDAAAKSLLLITDASMQMQSAIDEVQRRNIQSLFLPINPVHPCLVFYVSRNNIVRDTIQQLMGQGSADLKKPLKVIFMGEEAMDEGGVRKEFFMLLLRELLDPKYGMFKFYDEQSGVQWFAPFTFEEQQMYLLVGCLCGLAIYNAVIIQLDFPLALFKKLLRRPPTIEDLVEMMPTVGKGLEELLVYEGDDIEDVYCLNFEVMQEFYGETKKIELVPGGANKLVNKENRKEYVDKYVDYMLNRSVEKQFEAFNDGFHKVCGGRVLELFHPQELKAMVVGNENYDFHELEKNTEYKGEYHRYHLTIKLFWDVFHDLTLEDKKNFLLFLTGSNRIPIIGMKYVKMIIQPMNVEENYLPVAHTCFNLLDLPRYSTKETMKEKLLKAIQQTEGFGLV